MTAELTPALVRFWWRTIMACGTRAELDELTRTLWQRYASGDGAAVNRDALAELRQGIESRRTMLGDPR